MHADINIYIFRLVLRLSRSCNGCIKVIFQGQMFEKYVFKLKNGRFLVTKRPQLDLWNNISPKYLGFTYILYLVHDSQLSNCSGLMLSSFSTLRFSFQGHLNFKNIYFKNLTLKYDLYITITRPRQM